MAANNEEEAISNDRDVARRRNQAECRRAELEVVERERRLAAKWYGGRFFIQIISGAIVASGLLATWIISYMQPLLTKKQEVAALDVQILIKQSEKQRLENEQKAGVLESENKFVRTQLTTVSNANTALRKQEEDAERNLETLRHQFATQQTLLASIGDRRDLAVADRHTIDDLTAQAHSSTEQLQQRIKSIQTQQELTEARGVALVAALSVNTLRDTVWRIECAEGDPALYFVTLRGDGIFGFNYGKPRDFNFDAKDRWRIDGSRLILSWTDGYAIETYDFPSPTATSLSGKVSNEKCKAKMTKVS